MRNHSALYEVRDEAVHATIQEAGFFILRNHDDKCVLFEEVVATACDSLREALGENFVVIVIYQQWVL